MEFAKFEVLINPAFRAASTAVGSDLAETGNNMNQVSTETRPTRGSSLPCPRLVAAAGSLLDYWTDFGRLIT